MDERPLTTATVARMLGVSPETVVSYGERGDLRGFRLPGGHWRFYESSVLEMKNGSRPSEVEAS